MKTAKSALTLVPLMACLGLLGAAPASLPVDFDSGSFAEFVQQGMESWEVPGMAVAVVKDGEVLFLRGFGVLRLGSDKAVDKDSLFAIGSTTKAMTAAALAILVEEGKIAWSDPVVRHLPEFRLHDPVMTRQVTVGDLLTHNTGLGNADFLWYGKSNSRDEIVRRLRFLEPSTSMRSNFTYQNIMYLVAGEVVEAASGITWDSFLTTRIFQPLRMDGAVPVASAWAGFPNVAAPHDRLEGTVATIENASVDAVGPAGSVWSGVEDMSKWMRMLLDEGKAPDGRQVLSAKSVEELFQPRVIVSGNGFYPTTELTQPHWTTYGRGWFQHDYRGKKVDFHTGSIDGMSAIVGLIREQSLGVCVLLNLDHAELRHATMYQVFDLFGDGASRDWNSDIKNLYDKRSAAARERSEEAEQQRVEGTSPSLALDHYAGTYQDPLFGAFEITHDDGRLRGVYGPALQGWLDHWNYDTFRIRWDAAWRGTTLVSFVLDHRGRVKRLELGNASFARAPTEPRPSGSGTPK